MIQSEASLKTLHLNPVQTAPLSGRPLQRVRPTASSRSYVLLRTSFAQIRRIALFNTFVVLAVCYAKHRIDQTDSSTFWYFTARLICANYQIGQADSSTPWHFYGLFTCYTSYQIGQTESSILWHFYDLLDCKTPNRSNRLFYPLTLDGSTIHNQLRLGGDHRHGIYTTKVYAVVWMLG